ncbi:hypothetical protein HO133_000503 [Letharia lupina]|uniref:Uncharacterized protein n=1 Tax=Letharia lupina TaxID=560253 RepID=A0A8H6CHX8_9LECA|nr:uncharacterized protein HO133_000503 [Letharia lupina]KAF6223660.1 hypothetical protein HO133_000503 [Letharia lupina]
MARGIRGYSMDIHFFPTFSFRSVYTDYPKLINSQKTAEQTYEHKPNPQRAPPSPRLSATSYAQTSLNSNSSTTSKAAAASGKPFEPTPRYPKLIALKAFLMATGKAIQAASHRAPPAPANRIHTLIQQTSGARPIPIWADFAAGISTFHERAQSSTSHASVSEISFGSLDANGKLTEESVAVALTFLGCDITSTTADEIEAVWILLGVQEGTRDELEEFLLSASR